MINPIIDWTDDDVWEYLAQRSVQGCELYSEGWKRLGCIACPMSGTDGMKRDFKRWPHMRKFYLRAFTEMLEERKRKGMPLLKAWADGTPETIMRWWIGDAPKEKQIDGQIMIDLDELKEEVD